MAVINVNITTAARLTYEIDVPDDVAADPDALCVWIKDNCPGGHDTLEVDDINNGYIEADGVVLQHGDY